MAGRVFRNNPSYFYILFSLNFVLPHIFGLMPMGFDIRSLCVTKSRIWHWITIFMAITFVFVYPIALTRVSSKQVSGAEMKGVSAYVEVLRYLVTYALTTAIFISQVLFPDHLRIYINNGIDMYFRIEPVTEVSVNLSNIMIPYILRVTYSYLGTAAKNFLNYSYIWGLPTDILFEYLYFLPDFVITSATVRFHSVILLQLVCYRRLSTAFRKCIDEVNQQKNSPHDDRMRFFTEASDRFDYLAVLHEELYHMTRLAEHLLSSVILLTVANSFMNLTNMFFTLFLILTESTGPKLGPSLFALLSATLYAIDLTFTFVPCNALKREMEKTGLIIHNVFIIGIDKRLQQSIEQFSLQLLHQKLEMTARSLFTLDNAQFYGVIMGIANYLVIFIQFKLGEVPPK